MQLQSARSALVGLVLVALGLTHITIAAVTIFLHRHQAHRALDLHPAASAISSASGCGSPPAWSPRNGRRSTASTTPSARPQKIRTARRSTASARCCCEGAELYRVEVAATPKRSTTTATARPTTGSSATLYARYTCAGHRPHAGASTSCCSARSASTHLGGADAVDPVLRRRRHQRHRPLLGLPQFRSPSDARSNIVPWGILIGGEELHNNHHAYATSAKLSKQLVRVRHRLGVHPHAGDRSAWRRCAKSRRGCSSTRPRRVRRRHAAGRHHPPLRRAGQVREILAPDGRGRAPPAAGHRDQGLTKSKALDPVKYLLQRDARELPEKESAVLQQALHASTVLSTIYAMRQDLTALWSRSAASKEQLVKQLEDWCGRAEDSGIGALRAFSRTLRCYDSLAGEMK